jgi:hypothetical protein
VSRSAFARAKIAELWPEHVICESDHDQEPLVDREHGIVCACREVLGWPADRKAALEAEEARGDVHPDLAETAHDMDTTYQRDQRDRAALTGEDEPSDTGEGYDPAVPDQFANRLSDDQDPDMLADLADQSGPDQPPADPPWDTTDEVEHLVDAGYQRASDVLSAEGRTGVDANGVGWVAPPGTTDDQMRAAGVEPSADLAEQQWEPTKFDTPVSAADPINAKVVAIDPTLPYGPAEVEAQLVDIERRLESGQVFQRQWEDRAFKTGLAFELGWARAMNECTESSADRRKAAVLVKIEPLLIDKLLAEHMVKAVRETMHNLRSQLSGFQSIARSVTSTYSVSGSGWNREAAPAGPPPWTQ